jgi:hypothetical protein
MAKVFSMSNLGLLHYCLGIEVKEDHRGLSLSQGAYALKILEKCGFRDCNPCQVLMEPCLKLSKQSTEPVVDQTLYRSIVGTLISVSLLVMLAGSWRIRVRIIWLQSSIL